MFRRGIFGGTFDPPHLGHISLAKNIADALDLDVVVWVPARRPPHKPNETITPAAQRLAMVELAAEEDPRFEVSEIELDPKQPPWTVFLLERFQKRFPKDKLYLLIGGDSLAEFTTWRDYRKLWKMAEICVALRPGWDISAVDIEILKHVRIVECPAIDISATDIRARVSRGEPIEKLVPPRIAEYIHEKGLYRNRNI